MEDLYTLTDIQYKDKLRKELLMYKDYLLLLDNNESDKLRQQFIDNIKRIQTSLQD